MKKSFNMNARIVKLLGEKNVPNAQAAITELIKNCYDAEGTLGLIIFSYNEIRELVEDEDGTISVEIKKKLDKIYIIDNGTGMNESTIDNYWMTIGTDNKELNNQTSDGRPLSGAMGIGRLSLDRLGNKTLMYTQKKDNSLLKWNVTWEDFSKNETTVDEVYADLDYISNQSLSDKISELFEEFPELIDLQKEYSFETGTIIEITELKDEWDLNKVDKTINYLDMIVPPTDTSKFSIYSFKSDDKTYNRVKPVVAEDFDYRIKAEADNKGVEITIYREEFDINKTDLKIFEEKKMGEFPFDLTTFENKRYTQHYTYKELLKNDKLTNKEIFDLVGKFNFDLYFLKQSVGSSEIKYPYKRFNEGVRKTWLSNFSGVKIYRDNFRVRPYGEKGSTNFDWLELQDRVRRSPAAPSHKTGSWNVRSNQVAGNLSISRVYNPNIQDMSNRQSLDENKSFLYLKNIIIEIINVFEKDRQRIMRSISSVEDKKNPFFEINVEAKNIAKKAISSEKLETNKEFTPSYKDHLTLAKSFENMEKEHNKEKTELVGENQLLRVMATNGVTTSSFGHELKSISSMLGNRVKILRSVLEEVLPEEVMNRIEDQDNNPYVLLDDLDKTDKKVKSWIDLTLSNVMRDKRKHKTFDLISSIDNYVENWKKIVEDTAGTIHFSHDKVDSCYIKAFESDFESIIGNLIANTVEAFKRNDAGERREIHISLSEDKEEINIIYTDSGPGLSKDIKDPDVIFDHLFTTRSDKEGNLVGTGLGMWIVRNIVNEYKGDIWVEEPREPFTIKMKISPKRRIVK